MSGPLIRIQGKDYGYPTSSKLGDAALIEELTGLVHAKWRARYAESLAAALEDPDNPEEDSAVSVGIVAMAVSRQNPRWPRGRIVEFVNNLDWENIEFIPGTDEGDDGPPAQTTANGNGSASPSNSDSDTDSNESSNPATSGPATSPTSPEEQSAPTT